MRKNKNTKVEDPVSTVWNSIIGLTEIINSLSDSKLRKRLRLQVGELNKAYLQLAQAADESVEEESTVITVGPEDERLIDSGLEDEQLITGEKIDVRQKELDKRKEDGIKLAKSKEQVIGEL